MLIAARHARALVLIVAALVAAGGESLALPVAHLFADHHHEIVFSAENGNWQWAQVAGHQGDAAPLSMEHRGHDHEMRQTEAPLRFRKTAALPLPLIALAVLDGDPDARQTASCHGSPDSEPDIGKPDLALLEPLRV